MHKRPYNHDVLKSLSFADFVRFSYGDYRNPVTMWNMKNNSYVELENYVKNYSLIRYEDLLANPESLINAISERFDIQKSGVLKNINRVLTNSHGIKRNKFHKEYYLNEIWKKKLRPVHIEHINEFLDEKLMQKLNYTYI
ncbi:MAG: hypothetical protein R2764_09525 [Bacteroidales bacterium]